MWRAALATTRSELTRLEAEPRKEKVPVLIAQVNEAKEAVARETDAEVAKIEIELDRLIVLGNIERLHVRVDINEFDISRFTETAKATAAGS